MRRLARRLHNFGRDGLVTFGFLAIRIALWHIWAKAQGKPMQALLGGAQRQAMPA